MKIEFRNILIKKIKSLSEQSILNTKIAHLGFSLLPERGIVAFYYPIKQEIDLSLLWEEAWKRKLIILFPRVINHEKMYFCRVNSYKDFKLSEWGIYEPCTKSYNKIIDKIFIPGLAFGENGSRLGYGKGYYDRFLDHDAHIEKIGICSEENLYKSIPIEKHDIFMDKILTEKRILIM